jgi:hypothetical protein
MQDQGYKENTSKERPVIRITSADDAWMYLEMATKGEGLPDDFDIVFDGWPKMEIKFNGKDWKGTVPTRIMQPLLDAQKDLHRTYVMMAYGYPNLRKLTEEDRDNLEIVVKVNEGSSEYIAELAEHFTEIAKQAVGKMESKHILISILGCATIWGGSEVAKAKLSADLEATKSEQAVHLSQQETERLKIMASAMKQSTVIAETKTNFEATQTKMLKAVKPGDSVVIRDVPINSVQAAEITQKDRAESIEKYMSGTFRVLANDASKESGFRIKISRFEDGLTFYADVPLSLNEDCKSLIQKAEWNKGNQLVDLDIRAVVLNGRVTRAVVHGASKPLFY